MNSTCLFLVNKLPSISIQHAAIQTSLSGVFFPFALMLTPGQRVHMVACDNRIEINPLRKIPDMKGFLKGIDTSIASEPDRT